MDTFGIFRDLLVFLWQFVIFCRYLIYKEVNLERRLFDKKIGKSGNPAPIKNFLRLDKAGVPVS
jgi:hypothetical protein